MPVRALAQHVRSHKHTSQSYYDIYLSMGTSGKCLICQEPTRYVDLTNGYTVHCRKHAYVCASERAKAGWNDERKAAWAPIFTVKCRNKNGRPKGSKNKRPYPVRACQNKSKQAKEYITLHGSNWRSQHHTDETRQKMSDTRLSAFANGDITLPQFNQGKFHPTNPQKYVGDSTNIVYRSGWEFRMMRYFDNTTGIVNWSSEEIRIPYIRPDDLKQHTYFPDFLIRVAAKDGSNKTFLIEVKPEKQCKPPAAPKTNRQHKRHINETVTFAINSAKFQAAEEWCKLHGAQFVILTEREIFGTIK
jgi:hypothetical protein